MHFCVHYDPLAYITNKGSFKQTLHFDSFLLNTRLCVCVYILDLVGMEFSIYSVCIQGMSASSREKCSSFTISLSP